MSTPFDGPAPQRAVDDSTPYRRSLRASRTRRAAAARRTRLHSRGHRVVAGALVTMSVLTGGALAADTTAPAARSGASVTSTVAAVQQKLGIAADGVAGPQTRKAVRAFQRKRGLVVDGVIGPRTLAALGLRAGDTADAAGVTPSTRKKNSAVTSSPTNLLQAIAVCESGGDPSLVSASGRYRGKYQFDRATWRSVGGTGDPAAALEAEQDQRATTLMAQRGPAAWPACAKKVGATG
ncbi:MAG: Transglycosylase domain protein [Solirubrobacterales bacterium]|nr:Transglycosylase domain protein [Solirubrobacterales bacterium]